MTINFNLVIIGFLVGAGGATIATVLSSLRGSFRRAGLSKVGG